MATQTGARELRRIVDTLYASPDDKISKYEVCGRLIQLIEALEGGNAKHVLPIRENDASNNTRQEEAERSPSQRKGSRGRKRARKALAKPQNAASTGSSSPEGRAAPVASPPAVID